MASQVIKGVGPLPQINMVTLNSKLIEAAKRVRCYVPLTGEELGRVALWNFTHFDSVFSLLYAFLVGDGNPELVMSIWENSDGTLTCEFGSQTGGNVNIYVDDKLTQWIRGGQPGYFSIILR